MSTLFPLLYERRSSLRDAVGGEQQMAMGRVPVEARLLMDELSMGLPPILVELASRSPSR
jgi:ABC-type branched-subunit amino acid transport system ATPase component